MDVVRLGERYTTKWLPDELIEGYSSMVFTERYPFIGDFQMKTTRIEQTLALLPEDTLISHQDTDEVMMVETNTIALNEEGVEELTVTGRSLPGVLLERRYIGAKHGKKRKMNREYTPKGAAAVLIWQAIDNNTGKDVTREGDFDWNTLDRVANVAVTDSASSGGNARRRWLNEGLLWPQLEDLLSAGDLGLRAIRPMGVGSSGTVISVAATPLDDRGTITRTPATGMKQLRFDLFEGIDRTENQHDVPKVIFSIVQGHVQSGEYLFSHRNYVTALEVMTSIGYPNPLYRNTEERNYTGLQRRVDVWEPGDPDIPDEPKRPKDPRSGASDAVKAAFRKDLDDWRDDYTRWETKRDGIVADFRSDIEDDTPKEFKKRKKTAIFTGDVSDSAPYQFKTHYNLGDKVTLYGAHGLVGTMVVSEHIRTEDSSGDRGYPGLVAP